MAALIALAVLIVCLFTAWEAFLDFVQGPVGGAPASAGGSH